MAKDPKRDKPLPRTWYPGPWVYEAVRNMAHRRRTKHNRVVRDAVVLYLVAQPDFDEDFTAYLVSQDVERKRAEAILAKLRKAQASTPAKNLHQLARQLRTVMEAHHVNAEAIDAIVSDIVGPLGNDDSGKTASS